MRPHTVLNIAISIDGKVTTRDRKFHAFGGEEDQDLMEKLRASADAVMIGAGTLRDEDPLLTIRTTRRIKKRLREKRSAQPHAVVVSRSLDFPLESSRFFACADARRFVCTGKDAPSARVAAIRPYAEVVQVPVTGKSGLDLRTVAQRLAARGIERLLLEGGGHLNFEMMAAGLVDECYVTLCPFVIGGDGAPTAFDGLGFDASGVRELKLSSARRGQAGRVFLHYKA